MKNVALVVGFALMVSCATLKPREPLMMDTQGPALNPLPDWAWEGALYEISIGAFTPEGTFAAAIPKLEHVRDLGVKTLWLAPFSPLGGGEGQGGRKPVLPEGQAGGGSGLWNPGTAFGLPGPGP